MEANPTNSIIKFFQKPGAVLFAAFVLFLPLLFLGTFTSHDWGDDFAQYIHQAGNIVHGIPQSENGFIFSQQNYIGPQAYPVGFPLMLSPVYALAGNNMIAFTTFISLIYIVLGLLIVIFYRRYFSWVTALVLALIFLYNPQMIIFKREVMSDIPFTALLVLNFILYRKLEAGNLKQLLVLIVFTGLMLITRPAGIVFIAAVAMEKLILVIRRKIEINDFFIFLGIFICLPIALYFIVNLVIFRIPAGGSIRDYLDFYSSGEFFSIIPENLTHHLQVFRYLYEPESGVFKGLSILSGSVILTMSFIGFIQRVMKRPDALDWFFVFYMLMMLVFPNNYSAFRMMVPIGFVMLFYAANGLKLLNIRQDLPGKSKAVIFGIIMMLLFIPGIIKIARLGNHVLDGPQQPSAIEAFGYIRKNVPAYAVVVFAKPRALSLYAGVQSMRDPFATDPTLIHKQIVKSGAQYLLIHQQLSDEAMKRYVRMMQNRLTKCWENKQFVLYMIIPIDPATHR